MGYRIPRISPSALAATESCPRFRPDGKENEAAAEGTMLHGLLEEMVLLPQAQWDGWISSREISQEHKKLLSEAASQLRGLLAGLELDTFPDYRLRMRNGQPRKSRMKPGMYPECEIERGQGRHGYIDLMIVRPDGLVVLVDYKMVRQEGHDYTLQLGAYAADVNRLCPAHSEFDCRIIAPRISSDACESHLWDLEHLGIIKGRIAAIEELADRSCNDDSVHGCPGDYCQYCHSNGRCKYQAQTALQVADAIDVVSVMVRGTPFEHEPLTRETFTKPASPAQRGLRRLFVKFLSTVTDEWKEQDKEWIDAHRGEEVNVPGWKIGWRAGRPSLDKDAMPEIRERLRERFHLTAEDIDSCSVIDLAKLKSLLTDQIGFSEKDASEELAKNLDSYMKTGASFTVWTQVKSKKPTASGDVIDV